MVGADADLGQEASESAADGSELGVGQRGAALRLDADGLIGICESKQTVV